MLNNVMEFKGTWRTYQQRVLNRFEKYKEDGKIHIVAAPGSGKTTLGIEMIKELNQPALVLVPTITIREQWINRIKDAFIKEGIDSDTILSQDLRNIKWITVITYQSLHSAMTKYDGLLKEETDNDDIGYEENVHFSDYDLLKEVKEANVQTICLDECHHLRSEWWKSLEDFKSKIPFLMTIALTATPPYDSEYAMWQRYIQMCGEIDEEITVPELVKEGSLCPHQDFVYFNYPTKQEEKQIKDFKNNSQDIIRKYLQDERFLNVVKSHPYLYTQANVEDVLENPAFISSLLIYLNEKGIAYPHYYQQILGFKKLESMNEKWMEILLQGMLYDYPNSFVMDQNYRDMIMTDLKSRGLIEKRKVTLQVNHSIEKMLVKSAGKCESIKEIVFHEYQCLQDELKLVILTDFIRKEYEKNIGLKVDYQIGVLPFFEMIRQEAVHRHTDIKLGVLCGSMVVVPTQAKMRLNEICGNNTNIVFEKIGQLNEDDYVKVKISGHQSIIVRAITQLFEEGYMQVLIGTKSLLGEGWDSPCVNALILASFVGSFMLSNQMRGRAIRTYSKNPLKTSHIWHLVCINPSSSIPELSEDYGTFERRMNHFLGLHYKEDTIETGTMRITAIHHPLSQLNVQKTNKEMFKLSKDRSQLKRRWEESLAIINKIEVVEENAVNDQLISMVLFHDAIRKLLLNIGMGIIALLFGIILLPIDYVLSIYCVGFIVAFIYEMFIGIQKIFNYRNPLGRLKIFGNGIYHALEKKGLLEMNDCAVKVEDYAMNHVIYLAGGTGHDKALFSQCIQDFFSEIDNQRYILYNPKKKNQLDGYFVVPDIFAKKKEDALLFAKCIHPFIGNYEVIYTRNIEGRQILLEARIKALANKEQRVIQKKKVKGALE